MVVEQESSRGWVLRKVDERFWVPMKMLLDNMFEEKSGVSHKKDQSDERKKVVLDAKYFRRMDKFAGQESQFRMWMSNLGVALGQVDSQFAEEIRRLISREDARRLPNNWNPKEDVEVDQ
eukprot:5564245-Karenia_brevis.AAC.1